MTDKASATTPERAALSAAFDEAFHGYIEAARAYRDIASEARAAAVRAAQQRMREAHTAILEANRAAGFLYNI